MRSFVRVGSWLAALVAATGLAGWLESGSAAALGYGSAATYTLTFNGGGNGTVTSDPAGISCAGHCTATFLAGTVVTLTATPDAGYAFDHWSSDCSGTTPTCKVTISKNRAVGATFRAAPVRLTVTRTGDGAVTSAPAGISCGSTCSFDYLQNTSVTLTAAPAAGAYFAGWGGACSGAASTCAVKLDAPKTVTATFRTPTLVVSTLAFQARWRQSRSSGSLVVAGTASDGADITVAVGVGATPVPISLPAGVFTQTVPMPAGLLPGPIPVQIAGTSHGITLAAQRSTVVLAGPPEGVVSQVEFSTSADGPALPRIPAGTKEIAARFRFAALPQLLCRTVKLNGKRRRTCKPRILVVQWFNPAGKLVVRPVPKRPTRVVTTFVRSNLALPAGTWRCVLKAGAVTVVEGTIQLG